MTGGIAFVNPPNLGLYPNIAANVTAGTRAREEAIHKGQHVNILNYINWSKNMKSSAELRQD
jgi:hypothetical protein